MTRKRITKYADIKDAQDKVLVNFTNQIPRAMQIQVAVFCAENRTTSRDVVMRAVRDFLNDPPVILADDEAKKEIKPVRVKNIHTVNTKSLDDESLSNPFDLSK